MSVTVEEGNVVVRDDRPEAVTVTRTDTVVVREDPPQVSVEAPALGVSVEESVQRVIVAAPGPQGAPGPNEVVRTEIAGEDLSGHRLVIPEDGSVVYADDTTLDDLSRPVWLTKAAALTGEDVQVLVLGEFTEPTWNWDVDEAIYLGANGVLTQTIPSTALLLEVALAVDADTIFYNPKVPIALI